MCVYNESAFDYTVREVMLIYVALRELITAAVADECGLVYVKCVDMILSMESCVLIFRFEICTDHDINVSERSYIIL